MDTQPDVKNAEPQETKNSIMKNKLQNFLNKATTVHGDTYDYSKVEYVNAHTNVTIICKLHGEFLQRPDAHNHQKQGCPICGLANRKHPLRKTTQEWIEKAKKKWNYDYSITQYVNKVTKIKFICQKHGEIEQLPTLHLRTGCQFCAGRGISRHSVHSFVQIANKIHDNAYDYSKTNFLRMNDYVTITCKKHGDFEQRAGNHVHLQNGCPHCAKALRSSSGEKEILDLIKNNYNGPVVEHDRKLLCGKEIDIYLPELKLGIEFHGLHWHLETVRGKKHHYDKWKLADSAGIKLVQIYSNEWEEKRAILESKLLSYLGLSQKIHARKTELKLLDSASEFLTSNHLQGPDSSKVAFGLFYKDELVSCMSFGPSRFNRSYKYELLRFCNKRGTSVVGGASKLLSHFRKLYSGSIISYADKRYSDGNLYKKLGFNLDGSSDPSFSYVEIKNGKIFSRMKFQKKNLISMPYYSNTLSEYEIMQLNGYDRIWDAGQWRFTL